LSGLVLQDVAATRGAGPVVSGVSLSVQSGSIVAIIGPNGAGKTSLLEAVSGVIPASAGRIELDGEDITRKNRTHRFRLGLAHVQQGHVVFPSLTVEENLRLACRSVGEVERGLEVFPELGLDEMSLGLAPVVFNRLLPIVKHVAESGTGVVLVEQFTHLALQIAREALVLAGGIVRFQGPAQDLLEDERLLHSAYLGLTA